MSAVARAMQAVNDRTNPVVIKELRQAVQSRLVVAILMLFLLINTLIVSGFLIVSEDASSSEQAGQALFVALYVVLVVTCMIFVPLYAAIRLTMERNDSNIDLLFITTIAPAAIIRGKFWAAVALTALIYSASSPFLTLTYLLRGIDLPSIFFALLFAYMLTALVTMLAIFVGSVSGGLLLRILMLGILLVVGGWLMMVAVIGGISFVERGLASLFVGGDFWQVLSVGSLIGLGSWGLLYLLAVAAVSPRSSNRMFPVRIYVTICWMVLGGVAGYLATVPPSLDPVDSWAIPSMCLAGVVMCFALAERESWTPRVRRKIPRNPLGRFCAWLFYTGAAGGVIWSGLIGVTTALIFLVVMENNKGLMGAKSAQMDLVTANGVLLYVWCYTMSGLFVRRMIFPKTTPLVGTALAMLLLGLGGTLPLLCAYLIQGPFWRFEQLPIGFVLANPFVLGRRWPDLEVVFLFLTIWGGLGFLVNIPWFRQQWREFRRYEPKPVAPPATAVTQEPPVVHA